MGTSFQLLNGNKMNTAFTILFFNTLEIVSKLSRHSDSQNYSYPCARNAGKMGVTGFVLEKTYVEQFPDFEKLV